MESYIFVGNQNSIAHLQLYRLEFLSFQCREAMGRCAYFIVSLTIAGTFNNFLSHCYKIIERIHEERVITVSDLQQIIILDFRANANGDRRDAGVPESSQNSWRLFTAQTV